MPIYEYKCADCKAISEFLVTFRDAAFKPHCSQCDSEALVKIISRSSFALKGAGWFKDGYAKKHDG